MISAIRGRSLDFFEADALSGGESERPQPPASAAAASRAVRSSRVSRALLMASPGCESLDSNCVIPSGARSAQSRDLHLRDQVQIPRLAALARDDGVHLVPRAGGLVVVQDG